MMHETMNVKIKNIVFIIEWPDDLTYQFTVHISIAFISTPLKTKINLLYRKILFFISKRTSTLPLE
jgi:hypothetical protein